MNLNLIYFPILIALVFTLSLTMVESINFINAQEVDPSQEQIEPIPPSNNTNQSSSIVVSQPHF